MRISAVTAALVLAVAVAPTVARAEITTLGGLQLGQKYKKAKPKKVTLYGCPGNLYAEPGKDKKIAKVTFEAAEKCAAAGGVADAIAKEFGGASIANANGDQLWEGTTASVILTKAMRGTEYEAPMVLLVPPGPGSKRICWPDDGFAPFWASFQKALATGKPDAIAASFTFPLRSGDIVMFADAKEFAAKWTDLIEADDIKAITSGEKKPECSLDDQRYTIYFPAQYADVSAVKAGDTWRWSVIAFESAD